MKSGAVQWRRMTLRRADGQVYLDRWGLGSRRIGAVFVHRMRAADPGQDLHDHPWTFLSLVLKGHYTEYRASAREAMSPGRIVDVEERERWSWRRMRLDECRRVVGCDDPTWTLVLCGPVRRRWGFYTPDGYMDERIYDETVRVHRRDLWEEGGNVERLIADSDRWRVPCPVRVCAHRALVVTRRRADKVVRGRRDRRRGEVQR